MATAAVDPALETEEGTEGTEEPTEGEQGTEGTEGTEEGSGRAAKSSSAETHAAVRLLVDGGSSLKDAFAAVAEQTGKTVQTVQTAYYRTNRKLENGGTAPAATPRPAGSGAKAKPTGAKTRVVQGTLAAELKQLHADVLKQARVIERAIGKVAEMEKNSEAYAAAAKLFGR